MWHTVFRPLPCRNNDRSSSARFGVYSNTDAQDGIPLTETFLPESFQNHGYYTAAVGKWHLSKISNVPVPEDKQTRDYHDNFTTFSAEEWQPQNRGFDYFMGFHAAGTAYYNFPSLFKNRERVPAKGYISDQLTDEAIGVVDRAKHLTSLLCFTWLIMLRTCQMIILHRINIRSNLIPVVKQQITTTLPFILLIRV